MNVEENELDKFFSKTEKDYLYKNTLKLVSFLDNLFETELCLKDEPYDYEQEERNEYFYCRDNGKY